VSVGPRRRTETRLRRSATSSVGTVVRKSTPHPVVTYPPRSRPADSEKRRQPGSGGRAANLCDRHTARQTWESCEDSRRDLADPPARSSSLDEHIEAHRREGTARRLVPASDRDGQRQHKAVAEVLHCPDVGLEPSHRWASMLALVVVQPSQSVKGPSDECDPYSPEANQPAGTEIPNSALLTTSAAPHM
jgi:hypothetical protein